MHIQEEEAELGGAAEIAVINCVHSNAPEEQGYSRALEKYLSFNINLHTRAEMRVSI